MKIGKHNLHFHSMSVHFTLALYPVAVFFLILSNYYQKDFCLFTYFHLMILAASSAPVAFATGVIEWKQKYKGVEVRIFSRKYRYGLILLGLGTACTLWYGVYPETVRDSGIGHMLFLLLNFAIVPIDVYLGFLGGRLIFGGAH
jgi:uncharacterized membrane protein